MGGKTLDHGDNESCPEYNTDRPVPSAPDKHSECYRQATCPSADSLTPPLTVWYPRWETSAELLTVAPR
jgi:hypothetical protein